MRVSGRPGLRVWVSTSFAIAALLLVGLLSTGRSVAFPTYSDDGSTGRCASCHGDYRDSNYTSLVDGSAWNDSLRACAFSSVN